jgi:hypothetical protein
MQDICCQNLKHLRFCKISEFAKIVNVKIVQELGQNSNYAIIDNNFPCQGLSTYPLRHPWQ